MIYIANINFPTLQSNLYFLFINKGKLSVFLAVPILGKQLSLYIKDRVLCLGWGEEEWKGSNYINPLM